MSQRNREINVRHKKTKVLRESDQTLVLVFAGNNCSRYQSTEGQTLRYTDIQPMIQIETNIVCIFGEKICLFSCDL